MRTSQRAVQPLKFAQAIGDDMPLPLEVVRDDQGRIVVHIFRRPDIAVERAEPVVAAAMAAVFGKPTPGMRGKDGELLNVFYRDEEQIRLQNSFPKKIMPTDSWYAEFPRDVSMILPAPEYLKDKLATEVKERWNRSQPLVSP